ncbi:hypothetical protein Taro_051174 [Colocasia esculenta]|uniref:DUS-like FMN-binding domain-containing protein n=1 Tax=Colocasia esculenta TaxID=4460 RepID=A0A843XFC6_COLES|nr:hypothetical protein [Colocasia esculenta]
MVKPPPSLRRAVSGIYMTERASVATRDDPPAIEKMKQIYVRRTPREKGLHTKMQEVAQPTKKKKRVKDCKKASGDFVYTVASNSPTRHFIIHARKALLNGLSPAQNRAIPPLKYEYYFALVRDFPELQFTINGGLTCIGQVAAARRQGAHGVMIGRAAYNWARGRTLKAIDHGICHLDLAYHCGLLAKGISVSLPLRPWESLGYVDAEIYGDPGTSLSRRQVLEKFQVYGDAVLGKYGPNKPTVRHVVKPLLNLFHSEPGNGLWKRKADAALHHCTSIKSFLDETLDALPDSVLDSTLTTTPSTSITAFADSFSPVKVKRPTGLLDISVNRSHMDDGYLGKSGTLKRLSVGKWRKCYSVKSNNNSNKRGGDKGNAPVEALENEEKSPDPIISLNQKMDRLIDLMAAQARQSPSRLEGCPH